MACPLKADSLRPTAAADRPARRSRPLPGSRARPACEHTLAASPPTPEDSAGCRHGCRLASTASSQLHTQRADEAPAFSPGRSLSGPSHLQCSRPADLGLLRSQPAHGAAGLCAAAPSRTLQPGGQRSHRTKADRGSQPSASVGTRPVRPDRRGRARAAAERRAGRRVQPSRQRADDFHKVRSGCRE